MGYKFSFSAVNGRTLTITRTDEDGGWEYGFSLQAYLPKEDIPEFTSTVYTYHGLEYESAPEDTTEVIFAPPLTSSRTMLSMVVNPWCGAQYLTPSHELKSVLSLVVFP